MAAKSTSKCLLAVINRVAYALGAGGLVATVRLFRVIAPAGDIEEAANFYGRILDDPGRRISPGRHYFGCGGAILACFDPRADGDPWDARPNPDHLYFAVADL